jgi:hypothetical protein
MIDGWGRASGLAACSSQVSSTERVPVSRRWYQVPLLVVATFLWTGCGIPEYIYLAPPILGNIDASIATLQFAHDPDNDVESFLGYEIYYKFYDPALTPEERSAVLQADASAISGASPPSLVSVLTSRGYRRIRTPDNDQPAVRIDPADKGDAFSIQLTFSPDDGATADWPVALPSNAVVLQRDLLTPTPKGFGEADIMTNPPDEDLPEEIGSYTGDPRLPMGLAIAAYGINFNTFIQVYSTSIVINQEIELLQITYDS